MINLDFSGLAQHRTIDRPPLLTLAEWRRQHLRSALLTIIAIDGKSPRSLGAQMAVNQHSQIEGYLTGGCLEHELALVAGAVMDSRKNEIRRYGRGSPYIDLRLPCGSGIDVYFDQALPDALVFEAESLLLARQPFTIRTKLHGGQSEIVRAEAEVARRAQQAASGDLFERLYKPALRLRVFGAGLASVQLAYLGQGAGLSIEYFTSEELSAAAAAAMGLDARIIRPDAFAVGTGDDWTASVLMFHEHEMERALLVQLLQQPGFYIGAVGNRTVNQQRADALRDMAVEETAIARITMPAGLVRQARNATEIAIGVLAEILDVSRANGLQA
jgi:xanthine dehydrogenase accessory factor